MSGPSSPGKGSSPSLSKTINRGERHRLAKHLQSVFKVNYATALAMVDKLTAEPPAPL